MDDGQIFEFRLERSRDDLFGMLRRLYADHPDYEDFLSALDRLLRERWAERAEDLKTLDLRRDLEPDWFQRPDMAGYVFYIDRFAGNLKGVPPKLDYLADLGITYVHFMPCLKPRPGDSDGGYSVADYRAIDPRYGTMDDLEAVTATLRSRGMSVCIDLVLNHTAREHEWAERARAGEACYRDYYLAFDDDTVPRQYEESLVEVFPENAPGNFTHEPGFGWVWTTFNPHQWDLNWATPWVFLEMADVMLSLANKGVDILRFDAVAFMWKRMGTRCQSEPEVHWILRALRAASRIAAPALIHLEEAIVSPDELIPYLGVGEHEGKVGNLAYHNSLMVQYWSALASRDTRLMTHVLHNRFPRVFANATYATYIRCHDDIGWAVTDEDAAAVGLSGFAHRSFLSDFYDGSFPGSFSRGALFQVNPATGDKRISGTFASLAGLQKALEDGDEEGVDRAVDRILLGHALIASFGGIPLIYMGDEIALMNDETYLDDPDRAHDSRWIHRPRMDWEMARIAQETGDGGEARTAHAGATSVGASTSVYRGVREILGRRAAVPEFHAKNPTIIADPGHTHVFAFVREAPTGAIVCIYNFAERWTELPGDWAAANGATAFHDELSDRPVALHEGNLALPPYARLWLR